MPIRSGMTRCSIWPSVSSVSAARSPRPWSSARPPFDSSMRLAQLEGVVVGDDDLGAVDVVEHVARNELAARVVAVGSFGWRTRRRSLIVSPGVTTRKPRVNFLLPGRRTALIVCQAMSIAMTVVLPAPVASFSARRSKLGIGVARWRPRGGRESACPACRTAARPRSARWRSRRPRPGRRTAGCPLNLWCRQCWRSRAVSGVTCHWLGFGQVTPLRRRAGAAR